MFSWYARQKRSFTAKSSLFVAWTTLIGSAQHVRDAKISRPSQRWSGPRFLLGDKASDFEND
jgi:hypothetical protein